LRAIQIATDEKHEIVSRDIQAPILLLVITPVEICQITKKEGRVSGLLVCIRV